MGCLSTIPEIQPGVLQAQYLNPNTDAEINPFYFPSPLLQLPCKPAPHALRDANLTHCSSILHPSLLQDLQPRCTLLKNQKLLVPRTAHNMISSAGKERTLVKLQNASHIPLILFPTFIIKDYQSSLVVTDSFSVNFHISLVFPSSTYKQLERR